MVYFLGHLCYSFAWRGIADGKTYRYRTDKQDGRHGNPRIHSTFNMSFRFHSSQSRHNSAYHARAGSGPARLFSDTPLISYLIRYTVIRQRLLRQKLENCYSRIRRACCARCAFVCTGHAKRFRRLAIHMLKLSSRSTRTKRGRTPPVPV